MSVNYNLKNTIQERNEKIVLWAFVVIPIGFGCLLGLLSLAFLFFNLLVGNI